MDKSFRMNLVLFFGTVFVLTTVCSEMPSVFAIDDQQPALRCNTARMKCAFRRGCGMALHNYAMNCADIISGRTTRCSNLCQKSLIALTSTDEGKHLMTCDCADEDFCIKSKRRVESCRDVVTWAIHHKTVVSCSVAQWICSADSLCGTALDYYYQLCSSMFHGRKCSHYCNNSISILNRQEKAAKLRTCYCDGSEPYDCVKIRQNMDRLCFGKTELVDYTWRGSNEIQDGIPRRPDYKKTSGVHSGSIASSTSCFCSFIILPSLLTLKLLFFDYLKYFSVLC